MKTKTYFSWNILFISLGCFLFFTPFSHGMFGEEFDKAKAEEAARLKVQQEAKQQRERNVTDPNNQDNESGTALRTALTRDNGPSERALHEAANQDKAINIIIGLYFENPSPQERTTIVSAAYTKLASMERFLDGSGRILTPEDKICFIFETVAEKANVAPPKTDEEAVAAYQQAAAEFDKVKAEEAARLKVQQEARQQRERNVTDPNNQDNESGTALRTALTRDNGPSEKALEPFDRDKAINVIIGSYFKNLSPQEYSDIVSTIDNDLWIQEEGFRECNRPFTEESKIFSITRTVAKQANLARPATVAEAVAAYQQALDATSQPSAASTGITAAMITPSAPPAPSAPAILQPATVAEPPAAVLAKAAAVAAPPQPSAEFIRQKNARLEELESQITIAQAEIAKHEATTKQLENQFHTLAQTAREFQEKVDNFKSGKLFYHFSSELADLRSQRDAAILAKSQFARNTTPQLQDAKNSIFTLQTRIYSLERDQEQVAKSEDPVVVEYRRQQEAAARAAANELRRRQEMEDGQREGRAQRQAIEAQLAAQRAADLARQQPAQRSSSQGSTSGEESNHTTPEKSLPLSSSALSETVERLQAEIERVHKATTTLFNSIKAVEKTLSNDNYYLLSKEFWSDWDRYFDLAEQRSKLKQQLAALSKRNPEPIFKASDQKALILNYKSKYRFRSYKKFMEFPLKDNLIQELEELYETHFIHNMDAYYKHATTIQNLEQELSKRLQKGRQRTTMEILKEDLALLAPEEQGPLLQEIEHCVWQNMPGFSDEDRLLVIDKIDCAAERRAFQIQQANKYPDLYYTKAQQAAHWWKNEGSSEMLRRQREGRALLNKQMYGNYYY